MGLLSMWAESLAYDYEILNTCSRHQSPRSKCEKCIECCDRHAISISKGIPVINMEECTQCGKCIATCSVQAVAGIFPTRTVVNHQLIYTTEEHPPAMKELLVYYKKGITNIAYEEDISEEWNASIEEANLVLQQLGETPFIVKREKVENATVEMTRRDLFFSWKKEAQSLMKQMAPAKWRFNQNDLEIAKYYPEYQFAKISFEPNKCTLCKACEILCNKNCLHISETEFSINAQRCSACGLCEDICPEKAIRVEEKIAIQGRIDYPLFTKICTNCNHSFQTLTEKDEVCVPCVKRKGFLGAK